AGTQTFHPAVVIKYICPEPAQINNISKSPFRIRQWKMIVAAKLPHSWKVNIRISPGKGKVIGEVVLLQRVAVLIRTLYDYTVIREKAGQVNACAGHQLMGVIFVNDAPVP